MIKELYESKAGVPERLCSGSKTQVTGRNGPAEADSKARIATAQAEADRFKTGGMTRKAAAAQAILPRTRVKGSV